MVHPLNIKLDSGFKNGSQNALFVTRVGIAELKEGFDMTMDCEDEENFTTVQLE